MRDIDALLDAMTDRARRRWELPLVGEDAPSTIRDRCLYQSLLARAFPAGSARPR